MAVDIAIEKQVIGGFLCKKNLEYLNRLQEFDFLGFRKTFKALKILYESDELFKDGAPDLTGIVNTSERAVSVGELAGFIVECQTFAHYDYIRSMINERKRKICFALADGELKPEIAFEQLQNLDNETSEEKMSSLSELLILDYPELLDKRKSNNNIAYGIESLDKYTYGMEAGQLIIIAARPRIGKTTLALQFAENAAASGKKVLYFSLEMPGVSLAERVVKRYSTIKQSALASGDIGIEDFEVINIIADKPGFGNLFILDDVRQLSEIRRIVRKERPDIIFVDQLSLISTDVKAWSIRERFVYLTQQLKSLAMSFKIPVVVLAQLNRGAEDEIPTLASLKESGSIEEDADVVLLIHSFQRVQDAADKFNAFTEDNCHYIKAGGMKASMISVAKNRNGKTGAIPLIFNGAHFKFDKVPD